MRDRPGGQRDATQGSGNEEVVHALGQVEAGEKATEVCRCLGVGEQTFYRWKKQFSGLGLQELRELPSMEVADVRTVCPSVLRSLTASVVWLLLVTCSCAFAEEDGLIPEGIPAIRNP